jgi:hypothetical protein
MTRRLPRTAPTRPAEGNLPGRDLLVVNRAAAGGRTGAVSERSKHWQPPSSRAVKYAAFAAACALQLLFASVFVAVGRVRSPSAARQEVVMTQIVLRTTPPKSAPESAPTPVAITTLSPVPVTPVLPLPGLPLPVLRFPSPAHRKAPIDWARAAQLATDSTVAAETRARRQARASGELPGPERGSAGVANEQPSFPWSRQPLSSWFDFEPAKLRATFRLGKRCVLVLVLILPGGGCILGHIDPDPGRADLFDPKFRPAPLTLPEPALQSPPEPGAESADDSVTAPMVAP